MRELIVTIMAAGEGKRMGSNLPKVLHCFQGVPMIVKIVQNVMELKPNKIVVITGKNHEDIKKILSSSINTEITYVNQPEPLGTGDAIKCALNSYDEYTNVLILNGDMPAITSNLLEKFIASTTMDDPTKLVAKVMVANLDNPYGYGRIIRDSNGSFLEIREEKDCTLKETSIKDVNVGVYYMSEMLLKMFIPKIGTNNNQNEYYLTDIIKLLSENTVSGVKTYAISKYENKQIYAVNTQKELEMLEMICMVEDKNSKLDFVKL